MSLPHGKLIIKHLIPPPFFLFFSFLFSLPCTVHMFQYLQVRPGCMPHICDVASSFHHDIQKGFRVVWISGSAHGPWSSQELFSHVLSRRTIGWWSVFWIFIFIFWCKWMLEVDCILTFIGLELLGDHGVSHPIWAMLIEWMPWSNAGSWAWYSRCRGKQSQC